MIEAVINNKEKSFLIEMSREVEEVVEEDIEINLIDLINVNPAI
jgi:hypothetical protein